LYLCQFFVTYHHIAWWGLAFTFTFVWSYWVVVVGVIRRLGTGAGGAGLQGCRRGYWYIWIGELLVGRREGEGRGGMGCVCIYFGYIYYTFYIAVYTYVGWQVRVEVGRC